ARSTVPLTAAGRASSLRLLAGRHWFTVVTGMVSAAPPLLLMSTWFGLAGREDWAWWLPSPRVVMVPHRPAVPRPKTWRVSVGLCVSAVRVSSGACLSQLPEDEELIWSRMVSCAVVVWPLRLAEMVTGPPRRCWPA